MTSEVRSVTATQNGRCLGCEVQAKPGLLGTTAVSAFLGGLIVAASDPASAKGTIGGWCDHHRRAAAVTMGIYCERYGWTDDELTGALDRLMARPAELLPRREGPYA